MFRTWLIALPCTLLPLAGCTGNSDNKAQTHNEASAYHPPVAWTPSQEDKYDTSSTSRKGQPPRAINYSNPSSDDLVLLVRQARAYYKRNGKARAVEDFMNPSGNFVSGRTYFFVFDYKGNCLADWGKPSLVGNYAGHEKLYALASQQARHGSGWVNTKWQDPVTGEYRDKTCYIMDIDGKTFIGSGVYR